MSFFEMAELNQAIRERDEARAEVERLRQELGAIGHICFTALDEDAATEDTRDIATIVKRALRIEGRVAAGSGLPEVKR